MKIKEHGRQINQDLMWMLKLSCITAGAGLILFLLGKMIPLNEDLVDGSFTAFILSCLLSFVLLFFLHDGIKDEQFAAEFFECVHQGKYFSSATWQKNYRNYRNTHGLSPLRSANMYRDLFFRYLKKIIRRDWYVPLVVYPLLIIAGFEPVQLFESYVLQIRRDVPDSGLQLIAELMLNLTVIGLLHLEILLYISGRAFKKWQKQDENVKYDPLEIEKSYLEGTAFEHSFNCVVVGRRFVHAFDGKRFYTVERSDLGAVEWEIVRFKLLGSHSDYIRDEYRFYAKFNCWVLGTYRPFSIALNQYQIKLLMEKFFPDSSSDLYVSTDEKCVRSLFFASLKGISERPVIETENKDEDPQNVNN